MYFVISNKHNNVHVQRQNMQYYTSMLYVIYTTEFIAFLLFWCVYSTNSNALISCTAALNTLYMYLLIHLFNQCILHVCRRLTGEQELFCDTLIVALSLSAQDMKEFQQAYERDKNGQSRLLKSKFFCKYVHVTRYSNIYM